MGRSLWLCAAAVLVVFACVAWEARAAVISIDFGGEWIKAALVKPGVPMEIVLNKETKRKTAAVVSMRRDERLFGEAALSAGVKYPKSAYWYLQLLIGQKYDSPLVAKYRQWFPYYDMKKDEERGTILFQHDSETFFSPEELVAMILNYTRNLAQDFAEQPIRDVVITVPAFFSQAQRRAMLYAADLVGLNVLQLMTDAAATALNYGLYRQSSFNSTPQYVMFYDMGALSTTASIAEYRKVQLKEGGVLNTHPQLAVKGVGYDRTLGGLEVDVRLRDHLARNFESLKKTQGSVWESPRAMAKLLKEAKRVKQVLSANTDHFAQVEGLLEDVDFRLRVTREELEEMCADLYDRVGKPVKQALEAADMTIGEMDSVILMGGGTRVPRVQETLLNVVNKPELGKSLNTDEAAALGAVYQGAGHTKLFRVKKFIVKDTNIYPIAVSFEKHVSGGGEGVEGEDEGEVVKVVKKTLFQRSNPYPQKKVLTFNRYSKDFAFSSYYDYLGFLSEEEKSYLGRANLTEVYLVGVGDALSSHSAAEPKGIKAHFRMDDSGLLLLDNVESLFEYLPEKEEQSTFAKLGSTLSSLFGGGSSSEDSETKKEEREGDGEGEEEGKEDPKDAEPAEEAGPQTDESGTPEGVVEEELETLPTEEEATPTAEDEGETTPTAEEEGETTPTAEEEGETTPTAEEEEEVPAGESPEEMEEEAMPADEATPPEEAMPGDGEYPEETIPADEEAQASKESEEHPSATESDSNTTSDAEEATSEKAKKKKEKTPPTGKVVKVNLTAEVTILDLPPPTTADVDFSAGKLHALQERDDEKKANEKAKNSLESHIFETRDKLESEEVVAVSTEEQRETIRVALSEGYDWLEDEGYIAETKVYKEKLRELRRASRSLFKRVEEAAKRPKLISQLLESINISYSFVAKMKNMSEELQIFTDVEISTLETLANESMEWLVSSVAALRAAPPHEDPPIMSYQFEEQQKKLDREIMYLLNKVKTHPPPKPKAAMNNTNTTSNTTDSKEESGDERAGGGEAGKDEGEKEEEVEEEEEEATQEPLELPPAGDTPTEAVDSLPTSSTPRGEL